MHEIANHCMIASNFCYDRARDLFSFPVDRKLKSINPNFKKVLKIHQELRLQGCLKG